MRPAARSVDELLFHFRSLARKAPDEWDRKFARSILRCAKRESWEPSPRQLYVMHQLVNRMFGAPVNDAPDIDLIERDEGGFQANA